MRVCVQGLWHLGTVIAGCLAAAGHDVIGLEESPETAADLAQGKPPLFEPGLEQLLGAGIADARLRFTTDAESALRGIDVLWVAFDTPVDDQDVADVEYVFDRVGRTLPFVPDGAVVVVSSQLPIGSIARLEAEAIRAWPTRSIGFACSPENLRLGKAIEVFSNPDRIVVGVRRESDKAILSRLLEPMAHRILWMSVESAEMTKHAINAFLATSVTFANEIAALCELVGADAKEVEHGLKTESRIGPKAYLAPGGAFAGGTLARDIRFLNEAASANRLVTPLLSSVLASNGEHRAWARRKLQATFPDLSGVTVAVWGLTYKPETDTLRRSMAVELCEWLLGEGALVRVHDPVAKQLPGAWIGKVVVCEYALDALKGAKALVVATEWPAYRDLDAEAIAAAAPGLMVVDANRFIPNLAGQADVRYVAVGTPARPGDF